MKEKESSYNSLFDKQTGNPEAARLLAAGNFDDWRNAWRSFRRIGKDCETQTVMAKLLPEVLPVLAHTASPDRALLNFEHFCEKIADRPALFQYLAEESHITEVLMTLFAGSQFLSEILLRHPHYFELFKNRQYLAQPKSEEQLFTEAFAAIAAVDNPVEKMEKLRRFQRRELLRIGGGDLLGLIDFKSITRQLSHLAEVCTRAGLAIVAGELNMKTEGFAVLALGKLGGNELNYSSDIDLLFIAKTPDKKYQRLGQRLIHALTQATEEGFLYRVDMRLRPWGSVGRLAPSVEETLNYLHAHARLWEKQAFIKARWIAGDEILGTDFFLKMRPLIFNQPFDNAAAENEDAAFSGDKIASENSTLRSEVRDMKQRIEKNLQQKGRHWGEVKSGEGSIRDIEFVTQYLQLLHGGKHPEIRSGNTLNALARLAASGILPADQYSVLSDGYTFLRAIEHHLQMMFYQQTHLLPKEPRELAYLARRLGFKGEDLGNQLFARYEQHREAIRSVYLQYLGNDPPQNTNAAILPTPAKAAETGSLHLKRMESAYAEIFSAAEIQRHAEMAERLSADNPVEVESELLQPDKWRVSIVAFDYPGELSLICGLLLICRFNIIDGQIFTYLPAESIPKTNRRFLKSRRYRKSQKPAADARRKIVDVFTVEALSDTLSENVWQDYKTRLSALLRLSRDKQQNKAHGEVAKQVAAVLKDLSAAADTLLPVEIEIDNTASPEHTVLRIDAPDTAGFLYEFTNALALSGIYIARVMVASLGSRVHDTLFVTGAEGEKIIAPQKQRQLRAAVVLVKHFTHLLPRSPNPESAMLHFRELVSQLFTHPDWYAELASLKRPEVLDALARLLGVSDFLWDDFLRMQYHNLFPIIRDLEALAAAKSHAALQVELAQLLAKASGEDGVRKMLNAFKDREMFRIDMRYIRELIPEFEQFSEELSDLAEVTLEAASRVSFEELYRQFGEPRLENGAPCRLAICALGKFGGREIGFASDIELIFIYENSGKTAGSPQITNAEFFDKLVLKTKDAILSKKEGIFEIDLRLKPYGKASNKAMMLETFKTYFAPHGPAWNYERQALVKLRPIAGDKTFGQQVVAARDALLYTGEPFDVSAMRAMRERQIRQLVGGGTINAKFSPGALVDLEYLVQALQITHGKNHPELRTANTAATLETLAKIGILSPEDFAGLREAFLFLRKLIEALRMVRGNARDLTVPPTDSEAFAFLCRRLGYSGSPLRLQEELIHHTNFIRRISDKLLE